MPPATWSVEDMDACFIIRDAGLRASSGKRRERVPPVRANAVHSVRSGIRVTERAHLRRDKSAMLADRQVTGTSMQRSRRALGQPSRGHRHPNCPQRRRARPWRALVARGA
jgi:hypothetical protein